MLSLVGRDKVFGESDDMRGKRPIAVVLQSPRVLVLDRRNEKPNMFAGPAIELTKPGESFFPLPELRPKFPSHIHVVGPSGVGKSTWAGQYARLFRHLLDGRVVVVSADGAEDPAIPHVPLHRNGATEVDPAADERISAADLVENPLELEDLAAQLDGDGPPTLVIFDDVEGLPKHQRQAVRTLEQAVKERGRKFGVHSVSIYHRGAASRATASSLSEATGYVVFPEGGITQNTLYMLKQYAGIEPAIVGLIRRAGWGRWLYISATAPQYMLGPRRAAVMDPVVMAAIGKAEQKQLAAQAARSFAGFST